MSANACYGIGEMELAHVNTICVICWGLLGDVFVRVATVEALKKRFPHSKLVVVVDPVGKQVFSNHPDVDEVFVYDRNKRPLTAYLLRSIKNILFLRQKRFDLSVNLYSGGSSPRIVRLINARIRLGFDHTPALRASNNLLVKHPDLSKQWNRGFGSILQPLGVKPSEIRAGTSFYCTQDAERFADNFLHTTTRKLIAINLGAGKKIKRWPIARFVNLASKIAYKYDLHPLLLSNPGMTELADQFAEQYESKGFFIKAPLAYLDKDAALMKRCQVVITGDTSIMHLAFALKIPTLILFTHTRPEPVLPEDCLYRYCFIPDPSEKDGFDQAVGSPDISVEMAMNEFDQLMVAAGYQSSKHATLLLHNDEKIVSRRV